MKKRRWAALVLCLLLVFQTAALPADAAESVYFVAAGNEVLPLSDDTMPFWSGGYLYIAASTFSGTSRKALGVSYMGSGQTAVLYNNSGDRSLIFDLDKDYTQDREGNISYPGALRRGGVVFVPAYLVARYFKLLYSVLDVENGYLVWIRQPSFNMTDKQFANAAEYPCAISYAEYIKKKKTSSGTSAVEDPTGTEIDGKSVSLCLEAGDGTEALLDALDERGIPCAITSSSPKQRLESYLTPLNLYHRFKKVISGYDVPRGKPEPDIYLMTCEKLGVDPTLCYALEDSYNGIISAYRAGMKPVMIPDMLPPTKEMEEKSVVILESMEQFIPWMEAQTDKQDW